MWANAVFRGVFCGYLESWLGNIGGIDGSFGKLFFNGDGDTAGAGADVEDDWRFW